MNPIDLNPSDAELVRRTRTGDSRAYAVLWQRHARAARARARSFTTTFDPDDLVAEAYTKIYQSIMQGGGPESAFRAYLLSSIRNIAVSWQRRLREESLDDFETVADPGSSEARISVLIDSRILARAFGNLPERWQQVLWYAEIELLTPKQIAPLLGVEANAVSALAYRAREGLRQEWIQAHLAKVERGSRHAWIIERLGAYTRDGLGKRDRSKVLAHLDECSACEAIAREALDV